MMIEIASMLQVKSILLPSPACGRGAGGEGKKIKNLLCAHTLSRPSGPLSHKWERGKSVYCLLQRAVKREK